MEGKGNHIYNSFFFLLLISFKHLCHWGKMKKKCVNILMTRVVTRCFQPIWHVYQKPHMMPIFPWTTSQDGAEWHALICSENTSDDFKNQKRRAVILSNKSTFLLPLPSLYFLCLVLKPLQAIANTDNCYLLRGHLWLFEWEKNWMIV